MPCDHKFKSYLNLGRIDFEPKTLIVGTFNPEWPVNNPAEWFHGRTANNYFWDVLPRLYGEQSLINATPAEWKLFCHNNQIAITDLISSIDDADPNNREHVKALAVYADNAIIHNFEDFAYVNVVKLLQLHPTIENVYLTREITETYWRHLWNPVAYYCSQNNIHERKLKSPTVSPRFKPGVLNKKYNDGLIIRMKDDLLSRWQPEWHL